MQTLQIVVHPFPIRGCFPICFYKGPIILQFVVEKGIHLLPQAPDSGQVLLISIRLLILIDVKYFFRLGNAILLDELFHNQRIYF